MIEVLVAIGSTSSAIALAATTAGTTCGPRQRSAQLAAIVRESGQTRSDAPFLLAGLGWDVNLGLDEVLDDPDNFEPGEPRPNRQAIELMRRLLSFGPPNPDISTFYGEIDATWRHADRLLRLVVYSDERPAMLYFCEELGEALARGQTIQPFSNEDLANQGAWLLG